jgi:hypothetical protein
VYVPLYFLITPVCLSSLFSSLFLIPFTFTSLELHLRHLRFLEPDLLWRTTYLERTKHLAIWYPTPLYWQNFKSSTATMRLTAAALALGASIISVTSAQDDKNGLIDLDLLLDLAGIDVSAAVDILCFPTATGYETITVGPTGGGGTVTSTTTETTTVCPVRSYNVALKLF